MEKKVYVEWAFKGNESEKARINREIYEELTQKYKIHQGTERYNSETKQMEKINFDDYDLVYERKAGYAHGEYFIKKNTTNLTSDELALIFDGGNLCFGYKKESSTFYYIFED